MTYILRRVKFLNKLEPALDSNGMPVEEDKKVVVSYANGNEDLSNEIIGGVTQEDIFAPVEGEVIAIGQVGDPVFSQKMMGDGFAIKPKGEEIFSPVKGVITTIFETKHAIGITTPAGAEVLLHMGLDTVELKGEPFEIKCSVGQTISEETLLALMDINKVINSGKQTDIVVVFTNIEKISKFSLSKTGEITQQSKIGRVEVLN